LDIANRCDLHTKDRNVRESLLSKGVPIIVVDGVNEQSGELCDVKRVVPNLFDLRKTEDIRVKLSIMNDLADLDLIPSLGHVKSVCSGQVYRTRKERKVPEEASLLDSPYARSVSVDEREAAADS